MLCVASFIYLSALTPRILSLTNALLRRQLAVFFYSVPLTPVCRRRHHQHAIPINGWISKIWLIGADQRYSTVCLPSG
ncbi:hypothetical protein C8R43DRAFT_1044210 [Mycena crocata]|nr:hypothetical protein C8R43DRAFT_1044210 [Mycena crocata]